MEILRTALAEGRVVAIDLTEVELVDRDAVKKTMAKESITWPSWWCGPKGTKGPIPKAWCVRGWPTIYVLDHNGVIRFKNKRGHGLYNAVDTLLREMGVSVPESREAESKPSEKQ